MRVGGCGHRLFISFCMGILKPLPEAGGEGRRKAKRSSPTHPKRGVIHGHAGPPRNQAARTSDSNFTKPHGPASNCKPGRGDPPPPSPAWKHHSAGVPGTKLLSSYKLFPLTLRPEDPATAQQGLSAREVAGSLLSLLGPLLSSARPLGGLARRFVLVPPPFNAP